MPLVTSAPVATVSVTTNATSYATAAFTPTGGSLLVAMVFVTGHLGAASTLSTPGLTWTRVGAATTYNTTDSAHLFYAVVPASPASITASFGVGNATAATGCHLQVLQATGWDTAAASPIVQSKFTVGTTANPSIAFTSATDAKNGVFLGLGINRNNPSVTGPTGFTEVFDGGYNTPASGAATYRATGIALSSYPLTTAVGNWATIGVEIKMDPTSRGDLNKTLANVTFEATATAAQPASSARVRYVRLTSGSNSNHLIEIKAIDQQGVNQALNKTVLQPKVLGGNVGILVDGAVDNGNAWIDIGLSNVTVDLNGLFDLASINVVQYYYGGFTYNTTVEVSPDRQTWYQVFSGDITPVVGSAGAGVSWPVPLYDYAPPTKPANLSTMRYMRVYFVGEAYVLDFQALDYLGTNVALGKTVRFDSLVGTIAPAMYTDGIASTAVFQNRGNSWTYLDLGSALEIERLRFMMYNDGGGWNNNRAIVDVSPEGSAWTNLWDYTLDGTFQAWSGQEIATYRVGQRYAKLGKTLQGVTVDATAKVSGPYVRPTEADVRYVRETLQGSTSNGGNHWMEIQALNYQGVNQAQGAFVTASLPASNRPLSAITDGVVNDTGAYVQVSDTVAATVTVDLGSLMKITSIKRWHYPDGRRYNSKLEVSPNGDDWFMVYDSAVSGAYQETSEGKDTIIPLYSWATKGNVNAILQSVMLESEVSNSNPTFLPALDAVVGLSRVYPPSSKPAVGRIDYSNPDAKGITGYWTFEDHCFSLVDHLRGTPTFSWNTLAGYGSGQGGRYIHHNLLGTGTGTTQVNTGLTASMLGMFGNTPKVVIAEFDMDTNTSGDRNVFSIGLSQGQQDYTCAHNGGYNIKFNFWGNDLNFGIPNQGQTGKFRVFVALGHNGTNSYAHCWTRHEETGVITSGTFVGATFTANTSDACPMTFLQGGSNSGWGQYPFPLYRVIVFSNVNMSKAQFDRIQANPNALIHRPRLWLPGSDSATLQRPPIRANLSKTLAPTTLSSVTQTFQQGSLATADLNVTLMGVTVAAAGEVQPLNWTRVGNEGATVTVEANTLVRYGVEPYWFYQVQSGTFTFNNSTFGDPAGGSGKYGEIMYRHRIALSDTKLQGVSVNATATVSAAATAMLTVQIADKPSPTSLTAYGTTDWIRFGSSYQRKARYVSQISAISSADTIAGYSDDLKELSWTDGIPTASGVDREGNWSWTSMSFTVPATIAKQKLMVFTGRWNSAGRLTATLSDGSATAVTMDTPAGNGLQQNTDFEIVFSAASDTATLTVTFANLSSGNITLRGAALSPLSGGFIRRALVLLNGYVSQITDALKGTGKKPLVLVNNVKQERVASEGTPLVVVNGQVQTMDSADTLDI